MGEECNNGRSCKHYDRWCSIQTKCCNKIYSCPKCHDTNENHKINSIFKEICCRKCETPQSISNLCIKCKTPFGKYFCKLCRIWCNTGNYYHCDYCKLCRVGPREKFFHCKICDACMDIRLKNNHKHVENTLKSDCPICAEYLFTSHKDIMFLECGHAIHLDCFMSYVERSLQCPVCMKSMISRRNTMKK